MRIQNEFSQSSKVFALWNHLGSNNGFIAANQAFFNQTTDKALKKIIADFTQCLKEENRHLEKQLIKMGIKPTPALTVHSKVKIKRIFMRTRTHDSDISAALSMNIASSLIATSTALGEAISEENVKKYTHFHMKKAVLGATLIKLSHQKKWLPSPASSPLNQNIYFARR